MSPEPEDGDDAQLATAIGLYALGELSLSRAAERAGVDRFTFESVLEDAGIAVRYGPVDDADLERDVDTALDVE